MIYKVIKWLCNTALSAMLIVAVVFGAVVTFKTADPLGMEYETADFLGINPYIIQSDSMKPVFSAGDLVITKLVDDKTEINVGDIVSYKSAGDIRVIHRVIGINDDGTYVFKGDNNDVADAAAIPRDQLEAKYMFFLPLLGYVMVGIKTPLGLFTYIGAVLAILWLWEKVWDFLDDIFIKEDNDILDIDYDKKLDNDYGVKVDEEETGI